MTDFPYYNGRPTAVTGPQWLLVMAAVALGFVVLTSPIVPMPGGLVGGFLRAILFSAIPLAALALVAGRFWTAIFRRVGLRDVGWMIVFGVANAVTTIAAGFVASQVMALDRNESVASVAGLGGSELAAFFLRTGLQLFGEEVLTILPLLAVMYVAHARLGLSRKGAIITAWILSAVIFALVHLPSYNWNLVQVVLLIGLARLILSLAYLKTKNIWVSTGAHILNDWGFFVLTALGSMLAAR